MLNFNNHESTVKAALQKMLAGEMYNTLDPELTAMHYEVSVLFLMYVPLS